jgi:hypothetical protein
LASDEYVDIRYVHVLKAKYKSISMCLGHNYGLIVRFKVMCPKSGATKKMRRAGPIAKPSQF